MTNGRVVIGSALLSVSMVGGSTLAAQDPADRAREEARREAPTSATTAPGTTPSASRILWTFCEEWEKRGDPVVKGDSPK